MQNRLVVKVGTSTLTHETGALHLERMDKLARVLADIQNTGREVILVSSGAIGVGTSCLLLPERPEGLAQKQAAAAVGQCQLMHIYDKLLSEYGKKVAQILLTRADIDLPERQKNLLATFAALLAWKVIPVVNENDSVSHEEIEAADNRVFGDNDTLSAHVAALLGAQTLVLLTDIDGLYDKDPRVHADSQRIAVVTEITETLRQSAGGAGSSRGTGGMFTKLSAAQICLTHGLDMVIASGKDPRILYDIIEKKPVGTLFTNKP